MASHSNESAVTDWCNAQMYNLSWFFDQESLIPDTQIQEHHNKIGWRSELNRKFTQYICGYDTNIHTKKKSQ